MKELKISAIKEGTVIDHIPARYTFKVAEILDLEGLDRIVSISSNLKSSKFGKKGIIKVGGLNLKEKDVQKIALIAPEATLNIIKNFRVIEKKQLRVPDELVNIIRCLNPNCITNNDRVKTMFYIESKRPLHVRCHHCERSAGKEEIELL